MISSQRSGPSVRSLFARTRTVAGGLGFAGVAIRILIIDDFEAWHCIYTEVLRPYSTWKIVSTGHNSVEAVQLSKELQPDVVLLDVGLGRLDRLEAAREIKDVCPNARLLLLGTADSWDLADMASSIGAYGYIPKRDVVIELVPALQSVAKGKPFVRSANQ